jgi:hypothetical protein
MINTSLRRDGTEWIKVRIHNGPNKLECLSQVSVSSYVIDLAYWADS